MASERVLSGEEKVAHRHISGLHPRGRIDLPQPVDVGAEQAELSADSASTDVTEWKGTLNKSGPYTVRVYLIRSAARRREAAGFSLTMKITGGGTNAALSEVFASETRINHAEYLFRIKAV